MLYSSNPRRLSLISTLVITLIIILIDIFMYLLYPKLGSWSVVLAVVISAPLIYLVNHQIIETFIYKKIKIIYKNIHDLKAGPGKRSLIRKKLKNDEDIIESVNQEVAAWARGQQQEIDQLRANARFRREFIGNLAHELKTPIFNIQGYILTLLDGGLEDKSINRKYLERTVKSIDRMIAMVKDLDTISALESGTVNMELQKVNLPELLEEMIEYFDMKAQKNQISIKVADMPDISPVAIADKEKIRQVLINLIDNAIKYRYKQKKPLIKLSIYDMDQNWLIEVTDNGMGIPREDLPRIFERFYRVDKARSRDSGGTGLGLSIVKHIIDAHEQSITARSTVGVGTTFSFTLKKA